MSESATTAARAAAIEDFAAALRNLRESVGTPSFRELSGRSRAISHTTLHEAAQGNRLPSWSTTVEFVKACGADPADYRDRWDAANRAVRAAADPAGPAPAGPVPVPAGPAPADIAAHPSAGTGGSAGTLATGDGAVEELLGGDEGDAGPRRRRVLQGLAAVALLAGAAVAVGVVVASGSGGGDAPKDTHDRTELIASNCPIPRHNPPPAPATTPGDSAVLVVDVTLPDCSHLRAGQTAMKVWRMKNRGTVAWHGYSLRRLEMPQRRDQCQTITDVPIDDTAAGAFVDIRTEVTAPKAAAFCFVRFAVIDGQGRVAFPGGRPLNFQLVVDRPT